MLNVKDVFVDGLVQVAIILSLLRTDIETVIGRNGQEIQHIEDLHDILLGSSVGITRAEAYHYRGYRSPLGYSVHPKHIENYVPDNLLQELCSLNEDGFSSNFRNIDTYLVSDSSGASSPHSDHGYAAPNDQAQEHEQTDTEESATNSDRPGSELTREDMDLIDILWQQDLDLGIAREAFDGSLRKELIKEQEGELCKPEKANDEPENSFSDQPVVYSQDSETGEMVPSTQVSDFSELNLQSNQRSQQQDILFEDAMSIMQGEAESPSNQQQQGNYTDEPMDFSPVAVNSTQEVSLSRQVSFENRWRDVESLFTNTSQPSPVTTPTTHLMGFLNGLNSTTFESPLRALLSNASLGIIPEVPENLTSVSDLQPGSYNSTEPPEPMTNLWGDALFPNASLMNNETDRLLQEVLQADVENLQLIPLDESELEPEIRFENSSDSAFESVYSGSPRDHDWQNSPPISSPFDGVEGAVGGETEEAKTFRYFQTSSSFAPAQNNYSYSNASYNSSGSVHSASGYRFRHQSSPADVAHNHTYMAKPEKDGQKKKPMKPPTLPKRDPSAPLTKDEKKLLALNINYSISQIVASPVDEFNDMLTRYKFTPDQLQLMKDIRRRGKNKVAAQNCRKRKIEVIQTLEEEVNNLVRQRDSLQEEESRMSQEYNEVQSKYQELYKKVMGSLRDENGRSYGADYQLQHMPDGSVFLVPKGMAKDDDRPMEESEIKDRRKRKSHK